jgi:HD-like signal output (HDOD) protein
VNTDRLNVLFVDDERNVLDGLRRQLRAQRDTWEIRFALSGEAALALLAETPADIVVSDMRMPTMHGGQLLAKVRDLYPQAVRLMLSGQTDQSELMRDIGCIHQFLQKPCDGPVLCQAIERTWSLMQRLKLPALREATNRVNALPPSSETYRALVAELSKVDASTDEVCRLVADDPALTAKLLQLINSAFFGMPRKVADPREAVVLLGLKIIHGIVIAGRLFEFISQQSQHQQTVAKLWEASVAIGKSAANIARQNGESEAVASSARLAGLLSLIGRVILLNTTPDSYAQVIARVAAERCGYTEAEMHVYGATQDQVTAYALGIWQFPNDLVDAVAFQSSPSQRSAPEINKMVGYLHIARSLHRSIASGLDGGGELDAAFLDANGFSALISQAQNTKAAA